TTSRTPTWCSGEGDGPRQSEGGDPRPAGRRGARVAPAPRLRGRRGAGRPHRRARGRRPRRGARPLGGREDVRATPHQSADRELRDRRGVAMREPGPVVAVVVFPGWNDDRDAAWPLRGLGADAKLVWHAEERLPEETGAVVLPGGFSYG